MALPSCSAVAIGQNDASAPQGDVGVSPADAGTDSGDDGGADASTYVDTRDGRSYPVIQLGGKTWLARNLNFAITGSSYCYGDDTANCDKEGRLYAWSAAKTACPSGFHLPSDDEWKALEAAIGMASDQLNVEGYDAPRGTTEGTTLKAESGFAARMSGFRTGTTYDALNDRTYFWTSTTRGSDVWRRRIAAATPNVFRFTNPAASFAISVRCIAD